MAEVVLGLATSHGPQLNITPERWKLLYDKDSTDPRIDYAGLLRKAGSAFEPEVTAERWREKYELLHRAQAKLRAELEAARVDALVIFGDDQHEQFYEENMPMFSIFYGDSVTVSRHFDEHGDFLKSAAWMKAEEESLPEKPTDFPAEPALALHLIQALASSGFDIAASNKLRSGIGLGHAFTFPYRHIMPSGNIPIVPIAVNTFYPPNQATPRRCYELGEAVVGAIEAWDANKRVALLASGGLSHTIVEPELDRGILDALKAHDRERLWALPRQTASPGTSEFRNWVALGGAMQSKPMTVVDYVACYRSPAGTGCGMAFAYWE